MKRKQYLNLFLTFFKIGLFTFGGGFAMIPLMEREFVDNKRWIDRDKFIDSISVTQTVPGAVAINMSIYLGYSMAGVIGAIVAAAGVALPSFVIILIIAFGFNRYNQYPIVDRIFKGIRPAVAGLIVYAGIKLSKNVKWSPGILITFIFAVVANFFLGFNPVILIFIAIFVGIINFKVIKKISE